MKFISNKWIINCSLLALLYTCDAVAMYDSDSSFTESSDSEDETSAASGSVNKKENDDLSDSEASDSEDEWLVYVDSHRAYVNPRYIPTKKVYPNIKYLNITKAVNNDDNDWRSIGKKDYLSPFPNLEILEIYDFPYVADKGCIFPTNLSNLKNLKKLSANCRGVKSIPEDIGNLENLEKLKLYNGGLSNLPDSFSKLTKLKILDIHGNKFTEIPKFVRELKKLEKLNIGGSEFSRIPDVVFEIPFLKELKIEEIYHHDDLEKLVKRKIDVSDKHGRNSFMIAVKKKYSDIVDFLIRREVDAQDMIPLLMANKLKTRLSNKQIDRLAKRVTYVKIVNDQDNDGNTALHLAAANFDFKMAEKLVNAGARVNLKNKTGYTPLVLMCKAAKKDHRMNSEVMRKFVKLFVSTRQITDEEIKKARSFIPDERVTIFDNAVFAAKKKKRND